MNILENRFLTAFGRNPWVRSILISVIVLYILLFFHSAYLYGVDFAVYRSAIENAVRHAPVYDSFANNPFVYPPFALFLFLPFRTYPVTFGAALYNIFVLISFFVSAYIAYILFFRKFGFVLNALFIIYFLRFFPFQMTLQLGQINSVVLMFFCLGFYFLHSGFVNNKIMKQIWCGVMWGLAASLKITPILLLFYLLYKKHWISIISMLATIVFGNILAIVIFNLKGSDIYEFFVSLSHLSFFTQHYNFVAAGYQLNQSFRGFLEVFYPQVQLAPVAVGLILTFASIGQVLLGRFSLMRNGSEHVLEEWILCSYMLAGSIIFFGTYTWEHHLVLFYPLLWGFIRRWLNGSLTLLQIVTVYFLLLTVFINPFDAVKILQDVNGKGIFYTLWRYHALFGLSLLLILEVFPKKLEQVQSLS